MSKHLPELEAKLERANEHIKQLKSEADLFVKGEMERIFLDGEANPESEVHRRASTIVVPLRFSVLAGEAIHQTRSTLDHLAAQLILSGGGTTSEQTQFPICVYRPAKKKHVRRYERMVQGIPGPALTYIESLQPYNAPDPPARRDHILTILKRLNNRDKHHALLLTVVAVMPYTVVQMKPGAVAHRPNDGTKGPRRMSIYDVVKMETTLTPFIVFPEFGNRQNAPVVDGLQRLWNFTFRVVRKLSSHI